MPRGKKIKGDAISRSINITEMFINGHAIKAKCARVSAARNTTNYHLGHPVGLRLFHCGLRPADTKDDVAPVGGREFAMETALHLKVENGDL